MFHAVRFLSSVLLKFLALPVIAFLLMSCQPVLPATTQPLVAVEQQYVAELGETAVDSAFFFGFSMDYPTGWHFIPCYPGNIKYYKCYLVLPSAGQII